MRWGFFLVSLAICVLATVGAAPGPVEPEVPFVFDDVDGFESATDTRKIQEALRRDEPRRAAEAAIARSDFRFILTSTLGPSFIGFDCHLFPWRAIEFVRTEVPLSDAITPGLGEFADAFLTYANTYNQIILRSPKYPDYDICMPGEPRGRRIKIEIPALRDFVGDGRGAENRDLAHAARFGHIATVRRLIAARVDVNRADLFGMTPLVWAIVRGHDQIVEALLEANAEPNRFAYRPEARSPLDWAAMSGRFGAVKLLLEHGAAIDGNDGERRGPVPLATAAERGDERLFDYLLIHGANVNAVPMDSNQTPLAAAARSKNLAFVKRLLTAGADPNLSNPSGGYEVSSTWESDPPPLHSAVDSQDIAIVETLLEAGADPNLSSKCGGSSPVHFAVMQKDIAILRTLLKHGGSANAGQEKRRARRFGRNCNSAAYDALDKRTGSPAVLSILVGASADLSERNSYNEESVLHEAASNGDVASLRLLLQHGADPNFLDEDGRTPLFSATGRIRSDSRVRPAIETTSALIAAGADPRIVDENGETPLFSYGACNLKIAEYLIAQGVDAKRINNDGQTPLWEAVRGGCAEFGALLVRAGIDPEHRDRDGNTAFSQAEAEQDREDAAKVRSAIEAIAPKPHGSRTLSQYR